MLGYRPDVGDGGVRLFWGFVIGSVLGFAAPPGPAPPPLCPPPATEALDRPEHWEKKCRAGDGESCWVVGVGYEQGGRSAWGLFPKDPVRAAVFYRLACERAHIKSCTKL